MKSPSSLEMFVESLLELVSTSFRARRASKGRQLELIEQETYLDLHAAADVTTASSLGLATAELAGATCVAEEMHGKEEVA